MSTVAGVSKKYEFLQETPKDKDFKMKEYYESQTTYEWFKYSVLPYLVPSFLGASGGAIIGGPPLGIAGGGAGLLLGHYYSCSKNYEEYSKWLKLYNETEVIKEFKSLNEDKQILENFICPISFELIVNPVKCPSGRYYDKKSLQQVADTNPEGIINCPFRNGTFTMAQVRDAPEFFSELKAKITSELVKELNTDLSPKVKEGLQALVADLQKQIIDYVSRESDIFVDQLRKRQITLQEYTKKMNDLTLRMNQ